MAETLRWHDEKADNSPWLDALAELRQRATREGYCYQHVQAITVAIDEYAEKALGNRDYFSKQALRRRLAPNALSALPAFIYMNDDSAFIFHDRFEESELSCAETAVMV